MKIFKYGLPFAALALLASCANDNVGEPIPEPTPDDAVGASYINIAIAMPSTGTRAEIPFVEGETEEFTVEDATLYLFNSNAEKNKPTSLAAVIPIDQYFGPDGKDGEVTQSLKVKKLSLERDDINPKISKTNTYFALVILNKGSLVAPAANEDFDTWAQKAQSSTDMKSGKYFTMTNALGWEIVENGSYAAPPSWLPTVDENNIYFDTDKTANPKPVNIYVQRGVAKVSFDSKDAAVKIGTETDVTYEEGKEPQSPAQKDKVILSQWWLDVTNKSTYPVQLFEEPNLAAGKDQWYLTGGLSHTNWDDQTWSATDNLDRFFGGTDKFRRLFWAVDPNYSSHTQAAVAGAGSTDFNNYTLNTANKNTKKTNADYCLENTFSVSEMVQEASTRVILRGVYYVGGDSGKESNKLDGSTEDDAPVLGKSFISYGDKVALVPTELAIKSDITESTGDKKLKELFEDITGDKLTAYNTLCDDLGLSHATEAVVNYYKDGVVFYKIIIRHFTNTELGLDPGWTLVSDTQKYPTDYDTHLLGRYGLVRNNWYELAINKISGPGYPTIPPPTTTTDDEPAHLVLDATIHILGWAKRTHSEDL